MSNTNVHTFKGAFWALVRLMLSLNKLKVDVSSFTHEGVGEFAKKYDKDKVNSQYAEHSTQTSASHQRITSHYINSPQ